MVSLPIGVGSVSDQWMRRAGAKEVAAMRDLRALVGLTAAGGERPSGDRDGQAETLIAGSNVH